MQNFRSIKLKLMAVQCLLYKSMREANFIGHAAYSSVRCISQKDITKMKKKNAVEKDDQNDKGN